MSSLTAPSEKKETIRVVIVFCPEGQVWQRQLSLPAGSSITSALDISGFFNEFPAVTIEKISVGIFGTHRSLQHELQDHDRIEIYSPLQVDPKIARRRRAAHREKNRTIKKKMPVNDMTRS